MRLITTVAVLTCAVAALGDSTVTLTLTSPQNGLTVGAGTTVSWTISALVVGDDAGLALISVDMTPDAANPAFDIPPGVAPTTHPMDYFSRPLGIANPGEGGATTGYIGVQRGTAGAKKLVQIGGGLNTFGTAMAPGTGIGEYAGVPTAVGHTTPQVILTGSFSAPATEGTYRFFLENAFANVLVQRNEPPAFSPVVPATSIVTTGAEFTFTVGVQGGACCDQYGGCTITQAAGCTYPSKYLGDGTTCSPNPCPTWCLGDMNCSGGSPTFDDIKYFSAGIGSESSWWSYYKAQNAGADPTCYWLQGDYNVPRNGVEFSDIKPFAASIGQPCIPYAP